MDNNKPTPMPAAIAEGIEYAAKAADLAALSPPERMKHHRKTLRAIGFNQGVEGVANYKKANPEAASIRVQVASLAYSPKPKGYDQFLVRLVDHWLSSDAGVKATNVADVERLNSSLSANFNPANHFSEPLSVGRRKKIKAAFAAHGIPLDMEKVDTMSKVRAAAKAAKVNLAGDRTFGGIGVIAGGDLSINGRTFPIEVHGKREAIRATIDGRRVRFYIDDLEWIAEWFAGGRPDPLLSTNIISMGESAQRAKIGENERRAPSEISELVQSASPLGARIAALKPRQSLHPDDDEIDPLAF